MNIYCAPFGTFIFISGNKVRLKYIIARYNINHADYSWFVYSNSLVLIPNSEHDKMERRRCFGRSDMLRRNQSSM